MEKELKRLIVDISLMVVLLIIVVPICVSASSEYKEKKALLLGRVDAMVDISNNGDMKRVTVYSNYDKKIKVNLILKINKFYNDYSIYIDGNVYNLNELNYKDDGEYRYYNLGIYEIDMVWEFDFRIMVNGNRYYDETIIYSFKVERFL